MATLLSFPFPWKCRPGSLAMHPEYGLCNVIRSSGAMRTVLCETHIPDAVPDTSDLGPDERPEDILYSEQVHVYEVEVDVNVLKEMPLDPDPMKQPFSRITGLDRRWGREESRLPAFFHGRARSGPVERVATLAPPERCPVGALVWLAGHGLCEVVDVAGVTGEWRRVFRETRETDENGEDVWGGYEVVAHLDDLRWLRPEVEMQGRGGLLRLGKNPG